MDAHKLWMLRDFIGTNKVLFRIPVYQRNYDWSEANCDRLLDDIYAIISSGDKHFLGTIVFMAAKSGGFTLQEYTIIDGQQRLTTMMLILKALAVVAETVGDTCFQEIDEQYLHNKYCDEKYKVKLKPIKSDNNQFCWQIKLMKWMRTRIFSRTIGFAKNGLNDGLKRASVHHRYLMRLQNLRSLRLF